MSIKCDFLIVISARDVSDHLGAVTEDNTVVVQGDGFREPP